MAFKEDASGADGEMADAESAVKGAEQNVGNKSTVGQLVEVATLIFLAEWGDRCAGASAKATPANWYQSMSMFLKFLGGHLLSTLVS